MNCTWIKYCCIALVSAFLVSGVPSLSHAGDDPITITSDPFDLFFVSDTTDPFCGSNSTGCKDVKCNTTGGDNNSNACSKKGKRSESSPTAPSYCYCCPEVHTGPATPSGQRYCKCDAGAQTTDCKTEKKLKNKTLANGAIVP